MERKTRIPPHVFWPGLVVGLLCVSFTAAIITVVAAVSDPSFSVEEDYYDKALRWDEHRAQQAHNEALGWSAQVALGRPDALGKRALMVTLVDGAGAPIEGAVVVASYFHRANKPDEQTTALAPTGTAGEYAAPADVARAGLWDISLTVTARGETFTSATTLDLERS